MSISEKGARQRPNTISCTFQARSMESAQMERLSRPAGPNSDVRDRNHRPWTVVLEPDLGAQMTGPRFDDPRAEPGFDAGTIRGNADARVTDGQRPGGSAGMIFDQNLASPMAWKGVLEGVYHQLGDDQAETDRYFRLGHAFVHLPGQRALVVVADH